MSAVALKNKASDKKMELSQTHAYYFNNLTCVHQTENQLYIMDRETTLVLNFQQISYQAIEQIIHALRLVRDKKVQDRKSIIEQELLSLKLPNSLTKAATGATTAAATTAATTATTTAMVAATAAATAATKTAS
ncbi:MAG: hypothetical protein HC894_19240 [Microcoleus sp. SM1_3_4]|nr:hypothetical protein [Microcoleus sp. SM1_3_4]